jgi:hypothetical protein
MTKAELKECADAFASFIEYVKEYSDPVTDEPRYVAARRALRKLRGRVIPTSKTKKTPT